MAGTATSMQEFKALREIKLPNKTTVQMFEVINNMLDLDVPDRNLDLSLIHI